MDETKLLNKIGVLIDQKLEPLKEQIGSVKEQLDNVELKVETINTKIDKSQQDILDTLTDLIHTGYNLHEERIKKLEVHSTSHH